MNMIKLVYIKTMVCVVIALQQISVISLIVALFTQKLFWRVIYSIENQ